MWPLLKIALQETPEEQGEEGGVEAHTPPPPVEEELPEERLDEDGEEVC